MVDQLVAELAGDLRLQLFDFLGGELDHLAVAQIDQMIVVTVTPLLVARAPPAKSMTLADPSALEPLSVGTPPGLRGC